MFSVSRDKRILREFPELELSLSTGTEIGGTTAIETNFHETVVIQRGISPRTENHGTGQSCPVLISGFGLFVYQC